MAAQLEHTDKSSEPGCLSFKDLADVLSAQKSVPSLAQLDELIDRTKIGAEEVQPYLGFKAGNYSRHRVMKNEFVEMLVLCWKPGQRTPIHDHNGSHGAVFVHEGILWETMFDYDTETGLNYRSHRELRATPVSRAISRMLLPCRCNTRISKAASTPTIRPLQFEGTSLASGSASSRRPGSELQRR